MVALNCSDNRCLFANTAPTRAVLLAPLWVVSTKYWATRSVAQSTASSILSVARLALRNTLNWGKNYLRRRFNSHSSTSSRDQKNQEARRVAAVL